MSHNYKQGDRVRLTQDINLEAADGSGEITVLKGTEGVVELVEEVTNSQEYLVHVAIPGAMHPAVFDRFDIDEIEPVAPGRDPAMVEALRDIEIAAAELHAAIKHACDLHVKLSHDGAQWDNTPTRRQDYNDLTYAIAKCRWSADKSILSALGRAYDAREATS